MGDVRGLLPITATCPLHFEHVCSGRYDGVLCQATHTHTPRSDIWWKMISTLDGNITVFVSLTSQTNLFNIFLSLKSHCSTVASCVNPCLNLVCACVHTLQGVFWGCFSLVSQIKTAPRSRGAPWGPSCSLHLRLRILNKPATSTRLPARQTEHVRIRNAQLCTLEKSCWPGICSVWLSLYCCVHAKWLSHPSLSSIPPSHRPFIPPSLHPSFPPCLHYKIFSSLRACMLLYRQSYWIYLFTKTHK